LTSIIHDECDYGDDLCYEVVVIEDIIRRIFLQGYPNYGPMIDNMHRDFQEEAHEEILDTIIYLVLHLIRLREKRVKNAFSKKKEEDCTCSMHEPKQLQQAEDHCIDTTAGCGSSVPVG
jgi:hypothetical protein